MKNEKRWQPPIFHFSFFIRNSKFDLPSKFVKKSSVTTLSPFPRMHQPAVQLTSLRTLMNFKRALCATLFIATAAFAADTTTTAPIAAKRYGSWGVDLASMDTSVKPGDDFFKYVNGKWAASTQIPADRTSYGSGAI